MDHGAGAILVDVDGNQLIDLGCGIGVTTIGHAHPEVAAAAAAQAAKLTHTLFTVTPYENYVRVAEKLAEITPGDFEKHSILVNSGAEAVENAVKIARQLHRPPRDRRARPRLPRPHEPHDGDDLPPLAGARGHGPVPRRDLLACRSATRSATA